VPETTRVVDTEAASVDFAGEVVRFLARLSDEGPVGVSLSLPFGLSASMKHYGMGLDDTIAAVLAVRAALMRVPGLDAASEPVPLRVPDRVMFVLNLAVYLDGLLGRVARVLGVSRGDAADVAVEMLRSN
jgi:hypothetical protein